MDLREYLSQNDANRVIAGRWIRKYWRKILLPMAIIGMLTIILAFAGYFFPEIKAIDTIWTICAITFFCIFGIAVYKDEKWERKARKIFRETGTIINP